jgi:hypothetical protein
MAGYKRCTFCGQSGHLADSCPVDKWRDNPGLFFAAVVVVAVVGITLAAIVVVRASGGTL